MITLPGNQLPPPPQKFEGNIERNAAQSTPYWPARVVPPKGAPNVLLIMTDDTGFGVSSTFGGVIPTPNLDRIAANGLRYTNFNSTALCSPTRAGQYGVDCAALRSILPPNFGGGGGNCCPPIVVVALAEPGVPVVCCA